VAAGQAGAANQRKKSGWGAKMSNSKDGALAPSPLRPNPI